ncbi:MAG: hydrogenase [Spartobacteria bacterium]|nr:hydrogenase [Spartobacteria bacterium]
MTSHACLIHNGESIRRDDLPVVTFDDFRADLLRHVATGARVAAWFGVPSTADTVRMVCVLAHDATGQLSLLSTDVRHQYPSLTPACPQVHLFERAFFERWKIRPEGHPWLKPVRFPSQQDGQARAPCLDPYHISGSAVHEVAVGPVHAGIIEPGHFRFQCHGETVHHLEISLGYQHRGIERALRGGPDKRTRRLMETASGDASIGHTLAYAHIMEALCDTPAPPGAGMIRGIALELERLACHTGDLGALSADVGYLPTASFCGRLRGDFLNMTALLCGNRFGRGLVCPGGVDFDLDHTRIDGLRDRLETTFHDTKQAIQLLWETPSVMARFEHTGVLSAQTARELGLVGPACRACGIEQDVRYNFPLGMYAMRHIPVSVCKSGDVFGRAYVRWLEIQRACDLIRAVTDTPATGVHKIDIGPVGGNRIAVSLVEAWRGEVCHVAVTDAAGRFLAYEITDPSFHNWHGLAIALRDEEISDFPLCNKSFNLSYGGHDL